MVGTAAGADTAAVADTVVVAMHSAAVAHTVVVVMHKVAVAGTAAVVVACIDVLEPVEQSVLECKKNSQREESEGKDLSEEMQ